MLLIVKCTNGKLKANKVTFPVIDFDKKLIEKIDKWNDLVDLGFDPNNEVQKKIFDDLDMNDYIVNNTSSWNVDY